MFAAGSLQAHPPGPFYTIYGDVRDQYGVLLPANGSAIVMYQGGVEKMRETLTSVSGADYNYQLRMRIDMGRSLTSSYSSLVVQTITRSSSPLTRRQSVRRLRGSVWTSRLAWIQTTTDCLTPGKNRNSIKRGIFQKLTAGTSP